MSKQENCLDEFGRFYLDRAERRLLRDGEVVLLTFYFSLALKMGEAH
jgi:hypothetical protein